MGKKEELCPKCNHKKSEHQIIYAEQKYYCEEIGCDCDISRKELYPNDGKYYWPIAWTLIALLVIYLIKDTLTRLA